MLKIGIILLLMSVANAAVATALEIEIPYWKAIIYNIGHVVTGGLIVYFVMMASLKRVVKKEVEEQRVKGCSHPACFKKQKYELN